MNEMTQKSQPHLRRTIRHQVRNLLRKYVDLSQRVYLGRPDPIWFSEEPCALVYFTDEAAEDMGSAPRKFRRTLLVTVDVLFGSRPNIAGDEDDELDDWMDSRAFEIEYAMLHDRFLELGESNADWLHDVALLRTQPLQLVFEGDQKTDALRVLFNVVYDVDTVLEGSLDEFLRFNAKHQTVGGADAEDEVIIRAS